MPSTAGGSSSGERSQRRQDRVVENQSLVKDEEVGFGASTAVAGAGAELKSRAILEEYFLEAVTEVHLSDEG